jgi:hypothetical protein
MMLKRAAWQGPATLEDEYRGLEQVANVHLARAGTRMLELLPLLGQACSGLGVWGLTSHERLCLIAADTQQAPWLVIIEPVPGDEYEIRYLLPGPEAPWDHAMVWGRARSPEEACRMVVVAIERSGGFGSCLDARGALGGLGENA